jgi:signal transduction histidine kinase
MRNFLIILLVACSGLSFSQDSLIQPITPTWIAPEPEPVEEPELNAEDIESIEKDVMFLEELPKSYDQLPKEGLKDVLAKIDKKIEELMLQREVLLQEKVVNMELVKQKDNTITSLKKEKNIIGLTIQSGDLRDENGNLVNQNDGLKVQRQRLKNYLYVSIGILVLLGLIIAVILQRKKIHVQDDEIEKQLDDINKKNTYLEHAAHIIRHDMHSGINTYIPRGINGLEKRLTEDDVRNLKIEGSLKMIKEGLQHTQRVYKNVYEFTNLVKSASVLNKSHVNLGDLLEKFISGNAYINSVSVESLPDADVNEVLFCNAIDNLIKNGIKYNDSDEKIVNIYEEKGYLVIEDNGRGLDPSRLAKILKEGSKASGEDSAGLGINITVAILKEHGFELSCEMMETGTKMKIKLN